MRSVLSSHCRVPVLLLAGPCGIAAFAAMPACAQELVAPLPAPGQSDMLALDFDISRRDPRTVLALSEEADAAPGAEEEHGALDEPEMPRRAWDDDGLKREWSIQPIDDGPALEVAALGGGEKKSGKLAHVRVSWEF